MCTQLSSSAVLAGKVHCTEPTMSPSLTSKCIANKLKWLYKFSFQDMFSCVLTVVPDDNNLLATTWVYKTIDMWCNKKLTSRMKSKKRPIHELEQIVEWYNQKFNLLFLRFQFNMSLCLILSQFDYTILLFDFDCLYSIFQWEIDRSRILQGILFPDWPFPPILRMLH